MAMYFTDRHSFYDLKDAFDRAKRSGKRYLAVIEQTTSDRYSVNVSESLMTTCDAMDIMRAVREKGLRPKAPRTVLRRIFNTDNGDFRSQLMMSPQKQFAVNLPPDAQEAYQRYLSAVEAARQADMPKVKTGKRWFGRD